MVRGKLKGAASETTSGGWTFLTNHAHVLICIAQNPQLTMRDLADTIGITERAVQRIVMELERDDYLVRFREGRTNRYALNADKPLRHPVERHCSISDLVAMVGSRR